MKLTTIKLIFLRNGGYIRYMRNYLSILEAYGPPAGIQDEYQTLSAAVDAIEEVFKQRQDSDFTTEIARLDELRDLYLTSIAHILKGYLGHFDPAKVAAAKKLNRFITMYGKSYKIARRPLTQQCTIVDHITGNMQQQPEGIAALNLLGIGEWVEELRVANEALSAAYVARAEEIAERPSGRIKDLRIQSNAYYYRLRDIVAAQALILGYAAPYGNIIRRLNAVTEKYNRVLAQRSGRSADSGLSADPEEGEEAN